MEQYLRLRGANKPDLLYLPPLINPLYTYINTHTFTFTFKLCTGEYFKSQWLNNAMSTMAFEIQKSMVSLITRHWDHWTDALIVTTLWKLSLLHICILTWVTCMNTNSTATLRNHWIQSVITVRCQIDVMSFLPLFFANVPYLRQILCRFWPLLLKINFWRGDWALACIST